MKNDCSIDIKSVLKAYLEMQHDINNILQKIYIFDLSEVKNRKISKNLKDKIKKSCEVSDRQIAILKDIKDFFIKKSLIS